MLNNMTRWNPTVAYLNREPFSRLFDTFFGDLPSEDVGSRSWVPPVDIQETGDGYRLQAELPGLTKDDIQITLENNVLRLSGERKFEKDAQKEGYHRIERTYGSFARVLGPFVRDGLLSLPEAVRRMTGLPARNLQIKDRGRLQVGFHADVVAFDPATVADHATPADPHRYATGIHHVWVNGTAVVTDGAHTGATPGRFVRGPGWRGR